MRAIECTGSQLGYGYPNLDVESNGLASGEVHPYTPVYVYIYICIPQAQTLNL